MIGSSSIVSSVRRTAARSSAFKDCHCGNTLSTIRSRSFHIQKSEGRKQKAEVPPNNFCLLPSAFILQRGPPAASSRRASLRLPPFRSDGEDRRCWRYQSFRGARDTHRGKSGSRPAVHRARKSFVFR